MKGLFCGLLAACLVIYTPIAAAGATYTDDMSSMQSDRVRNYSGLTPVGQAAGYPASVSQSIRGGAALTLSSANTTTGWVEYQVQNADSVTVGIYTWKGTFVSEVDGAYVLGIHRDNMAYLSSQLLAQAQYSPATGTLYCRAGGAACKLADTGLFFTFLETAGMPGGLVDYGVNVYAGSGQGSLSRVSAAGGGTSARLAAMQYDRNAGYCYEEFTYSLPKDTTTVRIELNHFTNVDVQTPGGSLQNQPVSTGMRTTLSSVSFTGNGLVMGRPEPVVSSGSEPGPEESAVSGSSASSKASSSSRASSRASSAGGGTGVSSSAGASSSKFQGQITSSSSAKASGGKAAAPAKEDAPAPEIAPEQTQIEPPERNQLEVLQVQRRQGDSMSLYLGLYIAAVCGFVVLFLLRKWRQK